MRRDGDHLGWLRKDNLSQDASPGSEQNYSFEITITGKREGRTAWDPLKRPHASRFPLLAGLRVRLLAATDRLLALDALTFRDSAAQLQQFSE